MESCWIQSRPSRAVSNSVILGVKYASSEDVERCEWSTMWKLRPGNEPDLSLEACTWSLGIATNYSFIFCLPLLSIYRHLDDTMYAMPRRSGQVERNGIQ